MASRTIELEIKVNDKQILEALYKLFIEPLDEKWRTKLAHYIILKETEANGS